MEQQRERTRREERTYISALLLLAVWVRQLDRLGRWDIGARSTIFFVLAEWRVLYNVWIHFEGIVIKNERIFIGDWNHAPKFAQKIGNIGGCVFYLY